MDINLQQNVVEDNQQMIPLDSKGTSRPELTAGKRNFPHLAMIEYPLLAYSRDISCYQEKRNIPRYPEETKYLVVRLTRDIPVARKKRDTFYPVFTKHLFIPFLWISLLYLVKGIPLSLKYEILCHYLRDTGYPINL